AEEVLVLRLGQVEGRRGDRVLRQARARLDVLAGDLRRRGALVPDLEHGLEVLLRLRRLLLVAVEDGDLRARGRAALRALRLLDLLPLLPLLVDVVEDLLAAGGSDALHFQARAILRRLRARRLPGELAEAVVGEDLAIRSPLRAPLLEVVVEVAGEL